jgi:hypothetical protein
MKRREIIIAIKHSPRVQPAPHAGCLSAMRLANYQDGKLSDRERHLTELHLADCDHCLGLVAALSRSEADKASASVPTALIVQAGSLATPARSQNLRWAPVWAAVAVLILAVGTVTLQLGVGLTSAPQQDAPQTRYVSRDAWELRLLSPPASSVIRPLEQVFRWTEVPGALFYDVRLVSLEGDLLLRERVEDTRWLLPETLKLEPGEEYFIRIDAYLSDSKFLSSEHVVFQVGGEE